MVIQGCQNTRLDQTPTDVPAYIVGSVVTTDFNTDFSDLEEPIPNSSSGEGFSLGRGYQIRPAMAIELNITDLGDLSLAPEGEVSFLSLGISALAYGFGKGKAVNNPETSVAGYLRAGISLLQSESDSDYRTSDNIRYLAGIGVEYPLS